MPAAVCVLLAAAAGSAHHLQGAGRSAAGPVGVELAQGDGPSVEGRPHCRRFARHALRRCAYLGGGWSRAGASTLIVISIAVWLCGVLP